MNTTRRFAKLIITLWLFLSVLAPACAEEPAVQFSADNRLNILIVADTQDIENPQQAMLSLLNASLDTAKPDLVVFLGDMIHGRVIRGEENVRKAIDAVVSPVVERNIPFALVFGNHDEECGISNEEQLKIYQSYPGCLTVEGEEMPGCGNHYILIENPVNPQSPVVLWFLDSGNHAEEGKGTYDYVKEEQIDWMLRSWNELKTKYSDPVSYAFQHIPVPQVYNMIKEVPFGTAGAVTCYGPNMFKWYVADEQYIWAGHLGEGPCSSDYDSGEFDAWKTMGLKAAFFGQNAKLRAQGKDTLTDMRGTEPNTTYKAYLRKYINEARALGVTPILMSPICRAYFKDGQINDEGRHLLAGVKELTNEGVKDKDYVRCMREVAEEMNVPFLDMTKRSKEFFEFAGQEVCMSQYFNCGDKTHTGAAGGMVVAMQAYMLIMWSNIDELKSWMIFPNLDEFQAYAQRIEDEGRQAELNAPGERFTDSKLLPNRTENIDIAQGQYYIAQGGAWPAGEIDEVANRYLEYEVTPISPKKPYVVEQIVVPVRATGGDGMNIHINYGFGDAFASVTTVYENTALPNDKEIIVRINQQILVPVGQTLKIRVLPWYDSNGAPQSGKYIYLGEMQVTYKQQIKLKAAP